MAAQNKHDAMRVIRALSLDRYVAAAVRDRTLRSLDRDAAVREYRQFLLLVWINITMSSKEMVVLTKRADAIWHKHLEDDRAYRVFCDALVGQYITHDPSIAVGTEAHRKATAHTRELHTRYGQDGFDPAYLAVVAVAAAGSDSPSVAPTSALSSDAPSSSDSGDGASCAAASCAGG